MRGELFNTFLNAQSNQIVPDQCEKQGTDISLAERGDETQKREDRRAQAVKEREEKIKVERERVQATIEKSRIGLDREEGELQFRCAQLPGPNPAGHVLALKEYRLTLQDPSDRRHT